MMETIRVNLRTIRVNLRVNHWSMFDLSLGFSFKMLVKGQQSKCFGTDGCRIQRTTVDRKTDSSNWAGMQECYLPLVTAVIASQHYNRLPTQKWSPCTWRIIPISKYLVTPAVYKREQPNLGDLPTITMVINHVSKSWDDPNQVLMTHHNYQDTSDGGAAAAFPLASDWSWVGTRFLGWNWWPCFLAAGTSIP